MLAVHKVLFHTLAAVRIVTLASTGSADEIERSVVGTIGTTLVTGAVLVVVHRHYLAISDSAQNRFDTIGINRADNFVGMVMTLQGHINLAVFHRRQHTSAEQRRFFVGGVVGAGEEVEVCQRETVLGVGILTNLLSEPGADVVSQILRGLVGIAVILTPEVLHREDQEQCVAIDEAIDDTLELGLGRDHHIELVVCIEVESIVEVIAVVVVAVGRSNRHLHDNGFERFFKPSLPFPLAVCSRTILDEVAGEDAETSLGDSLDCSHGTTTSVLDILGVHDMTV